MNKCDIIFSENERYIGQYEITNGKLFVEIDDYCPKNDFKVEKEVQYKEFKVIDYRNRQYCYSSLFQYAGSHCGIASYCKYITDIFLMTNDFKSIIDMSDSASISSIFIYNPIFSQLFPDITKSISETDDEFNINIYKNIKPLIVEINNDIIERIIFSAHASWIRDYDDCKIEIRTNYFAEISLKCSIGYKDAVSYINEFDVMLAAYTFCHIRSNETQVKLAGNKVYLVHNLLSYDQLKKYFLILPIKNEFSEYVKIFYSKINYRNTDKRNDFILLNLYKPSFLEEEFVFYFRYIDQYMGNKLREEKINNLVNNTKKEISTYERLNVFLDDFEKEFDNCEYDNFENFKKEINSLRNHFIHEGYYFPQNKFKVKDKRRILYYKNLDYKWLFEIVKSMKYCCYYILYKEILQFDIDETKLKRAVLRLK